MYKALTRQALRVAVGITILVLFFASLGMVQASTRNYTGDGKYEYIIDTQQTDFRIVCEGPCPINRMILSNKYDGLYPAIGKLKDLLGVDFVKSLQPTDVHLNGDSICGSAEEMNRTHGFITGFATINNGRGQICLFDYEKPNRGLPFNETNVLKIEDQLLPVHEATHIMFFIRSSASYRLQESLAKAVSFNISGFNGFPYSTCQEYFNRTNENLFYNLCKLHGFDFDKFDNLFIRIDNQYNTTGMAATDTDIKRFIDEIVRNDTSDAFLASGIIIISSVHNINKGTNYFTIQTAIDNASPGDEIHVDSGAYYENVNVNKQLTLRGFGMPVVDAKGNGSGITLSSNGIVLEGFTTTGASSYPDAGIKVVSINNTLIGNNASNNNYGIWLQSSNNNTLSGNNAKSNNNWGIYLSSSSNNTLSGNNASNNGAGIALFDFSNSNTLTGNIVGSNNNWGIYLLSSSNNTLSGNNASNNINNGYSGILLQLSSNNTLISNNASNNSYGISLSSSSNNTIYNNYFNNTNNANDDGKNIWNIPKTSGTNIINGAFLGGNFWSDYAGNDTDGDGLGDTMLPYNSQGRITNGGDYLPLIDVSSPGHGALNITSFSPPTTTVTNNVSESRTFNITTNQIVNVTWYINGTTIFNQTGINGSSYTNTSAAIGTWTVNATATNPNGTISLEWTWIVTENLRGGSKRQWNIRRRW